MRILTIVFLLIGCNNTSSLQNTRNNLLHLKPGMSKQEAHKIMGRGHKNVHAPHRSAIYIIKTNTIIEAFFYRIEAIKKGGTNDAGLAPIVFNNGKLVGWGNEFLAEYCRQRKISFDSD